MTADFLESAHLPPAEWMDMTVVQILSVCYLGKQETGGVPVHGRGAEARANLAALAAAHAGPAALLARAEELYRRRHGVPPG